MARTRGGINSRKAGRPRRWLRRLRADQRGQSAVEFMLVMPLLIMVLLVVFSMFFLTMDLLLVRYGAFVGARGVQSGDRLWAEGAEGVGNMAYNVDRWYGGGPVAASLACGGDGASLRVGVAAFFAHDPVFGGLLTKDLTRECCLGRPPLSEGGDNQGLDEVRSLPLGFPQR